MRPAVATVLSARTWEPRLVDTARRSGAVRLVGRIYEPEDILRLGHVDTIVVGAETAWISPKLIRTWRSAGRSVVGLHDPSDTPARRLLEEGGVDMIAPDTTPPDVLLRMLASIASPPPAEGTGRVLAVTGARGAPGRTTVAVAAARALGPQAVLLDADPLPNIGPALGIGPGPDLDDLVNGLRTDAGFVGLVHPEDGLAVLCPETEGSPLAGALVSELAFSMRYEFPNTVLETGPPGPFVHRMLRAADSTLLVVDGSPQGVIRAASFVRDWEGDAPTVIVNRVRGDTDDVTRSCRAALGLDPALLLPRLPGDPAHAAIPFLEEILE